MMARIVTSHPNLPWKTCMSAMNVMSCCQSKCNAARRPLLKLHVRLSTHGGISLFENTEGP